MDLTPSQLEHLNKQADYDSRAGLSVEPQEGGLSPRHLHEVDANTSSTLDMDKFDDHQTAINKLQEIRRESNPNAPNVIISQDHSMAMQVMSAAANKSWADIAEDSEKSGISKETVRKSTRIRKPPRRSP